MSIFDKFGQLFSTEDDDFEEEEYGPSPRETPRRGYGLTDDAMPVRKDYGREPVREPIGQSAPRTERVENVIAMPGRAVVERLTQKFKIVVVEPRSFDECPKLVDSLKARKPVIINLESIENDTARKVFDFLSGGTYALNGNVQKIAQNIFVFLPENVDVSTASESGSGSFSFGKDEANPWK
ncbi:MAG: cell division protein SepF [Clostridiales bacterium]|nr:cell division protein SepF [Clostridiales bacterium]